MIDINELTIGQARELAKMLPPQSSPNAGQHPFVGQYCICRCYSAGVHAGIVESVDGDRVFLRDSRRLWSWQAKAGVALSGLAQHGLKSGKIDTRNPHIYLTGVIEIIPCAEGVRESIDNA